jgi:hypothetical protein
MGGMVRLLATVGAMGMKALKNAKRKSRRKSLGLPEKTKMQQRSKDKVKESASKFTKRRKQLSGATEYKPTTASKKRMRKLGKARNVLIGTAAAGATVQTAQKLKKDKK